MAQAKRNKNAAASSRGSQGTVRPQKSRAPFLAIVAIILGVGAAGIFYKMSSAPKPIVLAANAVLPTAEGYLLGNANAPVTIMEFADFECPQCANFSAVTEPDIRKRLVETGIANMRFYDFPLTDMHPNTLFASLAASCAADQGQFWAMHDLLLAGQPDWEGRVHKNPKPVFDGYVEQLKLDKGKFNTCFDNRDNMTRIQAHQKAGLDLQVNSTPSFVIGGTVYPGNMGYDRIKEIVDRELAKRGAGDTAKAVPAVPPAR